jgi:hypothetical protein
MMSIPIPMPKPWYQSKMIWANALAILTALSAYFAEGAALETTVAAVVMGLINIVLRLVTRQPIEAARRVR